MPRYTLALEAFLPPEEAALSSEATRRAPMLSLRELVDRYRALAVGFGKPVPLSAFNLTPEETERVFAAFDEDYHINRFFHFTDSEGTRYSINGFPSTHVSLDASIQAVL